MTQDEFWNIVDAAQRESGGRLDRRYLSVLTKLRLLPIHEIVEFHRIMSERCMEADRWDLRAAVCVLNGGSVGDDGFSDFVFWLVSRGRMAFEQCIADAENVGQWLEGEEDMSFEQFGSVASDAYHATSGRELWEDVPPEPKPAILREPIGERYDPDPQALAKRLPKLFAKYWAKAQQECE